MSYVCCLVWVWPCYLLGLCPSLEQLRPQAFNKHKQTQGETMQNDTLYGTTLSDCTTCGRPLRNSVCSWCAAGSGYAAKAAATAAVVKDAEWHQRANDYRRNLGTGQTITADDLRMHVGLPCGSSNQVGALMHSWASKGLIKASGFTTSMVKGNHGRILREWEILA